ncbi:hypothetical protein ACFPH6_04555 [Streptomyces xiangluensis]|uniref:Uncharacterized protein n=1 Tax=Streptomyces xiangluensis TaxID=2665720 RepID=A0ABV8YKW9_9ACTN
MTSTFQTAAQEAGGRIVRVDGQIVGPPMVNAAQTLLARLGVST